jgi:hypothetical protein
VKKFMKLPIGTAMVGGIQKEENKGMGNENTN